MLFLSGAGLPPWIWDGVRADLDGDTPAAVVEYPRGRSASLADYADAAADRAPWPAFAVVAHSIGGLIATELLARHPGRVSATLGVSAVIPRPGRSFTRSMPFPARLVLGPVLRVAGTRPPAKTIRAGLASGLPEPTADRIVAEFAPESPRLYLDRASARELPAVRGYLHTSEDKEISPAAQRGFAATLDPHWTDELPTGHLPMLQDPARVSQSIRRLITPTIG